MRASPQMPAAWRRARQLIPLIAAAMRARTTRDWIAALETEGIPCGPINTIEQAFAEPQALARGLAIALPHASGVAAPGVRSPLRLADSPMDDAAAPPRLGQHTDEVLADVLGLTEAEIAALRQGGAI